MKTKVYLLLAVLTLSCTFTTVSYTHLYLPARSVNSVTENGKKIASIDEISFLKAENGYVVLKVGSGNYQFNSRIR